MKDKLTTVFVIVLGIIVAISSFNQRKQEKKVLHQLTEIDASKVLSFTVYPKHSKPTGQSIEFKAPDIMIEEFFASLTDVRSYTYSHETVESRDHSWFLEVFEKGSAGFIQISFLIPSDRGNIVVGELGQFYEGRETHYGYFQSQNLFQWYQKHSHRWLEPEHKE